MEKLKPGDKAPDFELETQDGGKLSLASFRGRKILLYFYPKADTPGCTAQACSVRDAAKELEALGVSPVGVSPDSSGEQAKFDAKFSLGFPLLSDSARKAAEAYGAWGEKTFMGRKSVGVIRSSFLIGEDGRIIGAWVKVKPEDTVPKALEALKP